MADDKQVSALLRRHEQKKRWEDSETNRQATTPNIDSRKVKFQDGCVFLAACSSGDTDEVKELLHRGADINTANVDGLTALHQACIDDNLDMVEFLVDHGAYVDVCDNEGWTPLHATASCGFTEIARYLLKHGANVAAVNNDGDLAIDIAEDEEMEKLLQEEMDKIGVDADAARREEEECMLADANKWLANNCIQDNIHPKTGATALHVAAAKGYVKVMNILIQAGADINARDNDGWTPLHAAVHWGQEESVQNLVDHMCDMDAPNNAGHTVFDLADKDMLKLLEELKKKQTTIKNANENSTEIIHPFIHPGRRRSSVTRMSSDQKQNVIAKTSEEERATLEERANLTLFESTNSDDVEKKIPASIPSIQAAETERKNELNKHSPLITQSWTRPPSLSSSLDTHKPEMPKIEEVSEQEKVISVTTTITTATTTTPTPTKFPESASTTTTAVVPAPSVTALVSAPTITAPLPAISMKAESGVSISLDAIPPETPIVAVSKSCGSVVEAVSVSPGKELVSRSISVPARLPTEQNTTVISTNHSNSSSTSELTVPSWRRGLSKTRSTSMVHEQMNDTDTDKSLPRSASSPRLAVDNRIESLQDRINLRRPLSSTSSIPSATTTVSEPTIEPRPGDRSSWSAGQSVYSPFRNYSSRSGYMPYYQRKQEQNAKKEHDNEENKRDKLTSATTAATTVTTTINPSSSYFSNTTSAPSSFALSNTTTATTTVSSPTSTSFRRSFEPPKRDEETETQRKARAKHARQTRRSTQGVDLKDIEKAEEVIRQSDPSSTKPVKDFEDTVSSRTSLPDSQKDTSSSTTIAATTTVTTASTSLSSSSFLQSDRERERTGSNLSSRDMPKDDSSSSLRRRNWDDRVDGEIRASFRRPREEKELASTNGTTLDITSSYVPRSQRNTPLSASDTNTTSPSTGSGLSRTASLRNRLRNGDASQEEERRREESKDTKKEESPSMDKDEKKELSAIRAKRARRERRSTGIVYDKEGEDEKGKENKPEEEEKKDSESTSSRLGRYGATDVPATTDSSVRVRPQSYTELTRSTGALDTDYKKLYEEEKDENTRLRKELDQCKKELIEAKTELDRLMRRNDTSRNTTTNDQREKRALERKVSEYEEELKKMEALKADNQRLKDENGALIRVISKLSK